MIYTDIITRTFNISEDILDDYVVWLEGAKPNKDNLKEYIEDCVLPGWSSDDERITDTFIECCSDFLKRAKDEQRNSRKI